MSAVKKKSREYPRTERHSSSAVNVTSFVENTTGFLKKVNKLRIVKRHSRIELE